LVQCRAAEAGSLGELGEPGERGLELGYQILVTRIKVVSLPPVQVEPRRLQLNQSVLGLVFNHEATGQPKRLQADVYGVWHAPTGAVEQFKLVVEHRTVRRPDPIGPEFIPIAPE